MESRNTMKQVYILYLRDKQQRKLYKLGYWNKTPNVIDRMAMSNKDGSNRALYTEFELLHYEAFPFKNSKEIEEELHHLIRNIWQWPMTGQLGIQNKPYYKGKMLSGVTELRVHNEEEINLVREWLIERLDGESPIVL